MIKNIVFDFGGVLVDWNPHYLFDAYFGDVAKADWFLQHICNTTWIRQMDAGKTFSAGTAELAARYPEWADAINTYMNRWSDMIHGQVEGMEALVLSLKQRGYAIYGLSNWVRETFDVVERELPVFKLMQGMVVSGREGVVKPYPEIYELLLSRYNLNCEECLFIDDMPENVAGARAVGMQAVQFCGIDDLRQKLAACL